MLPIQIYLAVSLFAELGDGLLPGIDGGLAVHTDESQDRSCVRRLGHDSTSR